VISNRTHGADGSTIEPYALAVLTVRAMRTLKTESSDGADGRLRASAAHGRMIGADRGHEDVAVIVQAADLLDLDLSYQTAAMQLDAATLAGGMAGGPGAIRP